MKIFQRVLHALAVVATVYAGLLATGVFAVSILVEKFMAVQAERNSGDPSPLLNALLGVAVLIVIAGICGVVFRVSWKWFAGAWLVFGSALGYLAYDPNPVTQSDLGPRVGGDDSGYRAIMWLSEKSPHSQLAEAGVLLSDEVNALTLPTKTEAWAEYVSKNREAIVRAWESDKLGREWVDAINKNPPAGVWPQALYDPIIAYKPVRALCYIRILYAYALASEGRCDQAVEILVPLIKTTNHLTRTSGNLVHEMIAVVVAKLAYRAAGEILKMGVVSNESRVKLAKVLRGAPPIELVCRHAFLGEHDSLRSALDSLDGKKISAMKQAMGVSGWGDRLLDVFLKTGGRWVVYNRNRTERMGVEALSEITKFAETRDLEGLEKWNPSWNRSVEKRNPVGPLLVSMWLPAVNKVVVNLWQAEDLRLDLLKQLEKP